MGLKDDLVAYVGKVQKNSWTRRDGQKVPEYDEIALEGNDAVDLEGTVLYADLAESTALVKGYKDWFAAQNYKNYLYCAAKLILLRGGVITAYDGDRVMGVFIGDSKNTNAAKCALNICYAVNEILNPAIKARYTTDYVLRQRVGVDTSRLMVARTGIRGSNDLVWVGNAANNAAKLAALSTGYSSYISETVYQNMDSSSQIGGTPAQNMWTKVDSPEMGINVLGSRWQWSF